MPPDVLAVTPGERDAGRAPLIAPGPVARARVAERRILSAWRPGQTGTVLAAFDRSCYLEVGGQVVAVVSEPLPPGPFTVVVTGAPRWLGVSAGAAVVVRDGAVDIGECMRVDLSGAAPWDATLKPWTGGGERLRAHLALVHRMLLEEAPAHGLARVIVGADTDGPLARAARPSLLQLAEGLRRRSAHLVGGAARRLAGLGPGLTPSGDDVLVGCLVALTLWPQRPDLRPRIAHEALPRTTRISAAYLAAAARGQAGQGWHLLRDALAGPDADAVRRAAAAIMATGETSGCDMVAGFLLAARAGRAEA